MSEAYLMSMPIIMNCLGGEMIYILCSRLRAQNITEEKSHKVILDIGNTLFNKKYQNELYTHKKPYKHQEVKKIFESFAHSSIMRLNTTSMTKLFELMLMTFKLQILRTRYPEEIYQIALNHYDGIIEILTKLDKVKNSSLIERIQEEIINFKQNYGRLSSYDYIIIKQIILRFLQGKNVKVSIFIQDNLQSSSSILYLPMNEISPPNVEKPGTVFDCEKNTSQYFELKLSESFINNTNKDRMSNFETELGKNMFDVKKLILLGRKPKPIEKEEVKDLTKEFNFNQEEDKKRFIKTKVEKDKVNEEKVSTYREENIKSNPERIINQDPDMPAPASHVVPLETNHPPIKDSYIGHEDQELSLTDEQKSLISEGTKNDFTKLSNLFSYPSSDNNETFKVDLFAMNQGFNANKEKREEDEDLILIEREPSNVKNKINQEFDLSNFKQNADEGEDDLLDLMDKL